MKRFEHLAQNRFERLFVTKIETNEIWILRDHLRLQISQTLYVLEITIKLSLFIRIQDIKPASACTKGLGILAGKAVSLICGGGQGGGRPGE